MIYGRRRRLALLGLGRQASNWIQYSALTVLSG